MLKNISRLEHTIGGKVYHFLCDNDSPLNEVKDALVKFLSYVNQIEESVKAQQDQAAKEQEAQDQDKVEPIETIVESGDSNG